MKNQEEKPLQKVDDLAQEIIKLRKRPLLVLYYPEAYGNMIEDDVKDVYDEFRREGQNPNKKIDRLDVLLHTWGGDPHTAYRIVQVIRDFSKDVTMLIPINAYSAGTLACLGANKIRLGHYAVLSPIDITIERTESGETTESVELMDIDYYMEFVKDCRTRIEESLQGVEKLYRKKGLRTDVEEPLMVEMVKQVEALNIGKFYRARTLTGHYAEMLLDDYMFNGFSDKTERRNFIIRQLLFECPTHTFQIDFHMAEKWKLPVEEMEVKESDLTKELVSELRRLTKKGVICKYIGKRYKLPFFILYTSGGIKHGRSREKEKRNEQS